MSNRSKVEPDQVGSGVDLSIGTYVIVVLKELDDGRDQADSLVGVVLNVSGNGVDRGLGPHEVGEGVGKSEEVALLGVPVEEVLQVIDKCVHLVHGVVAREVVIDDVVHLV